MFNCKVSGCPNKYKARGYCSTHHKQILRYGRIIITKPHKHGLSSSPTYKTWTMMKERCLNPKHVRYARYGGRGIMICDRWLHSFENFLEDMGERPLNKTLDRINPDGDYEIYNCRWATLHRQAANRVNKSKIIGVYYSDKQGKRRWRATLTVNKKRVLSRYFATLEEAQAARREAEIKWLGVGRE